GPETRAFLQPYVDGINAYIEGHASDHPIELRIAGLQPRPWAVADLVTLVHFVHYTHATNFKAEVVAQQLIDHLGAERAVDLLPVTRNPDWATGTANAAPPERPARTAGKTAEKSVALGLDWSRLLIAPDTLNHQGLGSNNWAVGP